MHITSTLPVTPSKPSTLMACAGTVNTPSKGKPRSLFDFNVASLVAKKIQK